MAALALAAGCLRQIFKHIPLLCPNQTPTCNSPGHGKLSQMFFQVVAVNVNATECRRRVSMPLGVAAEYKYDFHM